MRKRIFWLILCFLPVLSEAQQLPVYSQFFMNPYLYNPAFAGVEGHTVVFFMHRQQWLGINGAPRYSHVTFHTPLKNSLAIGGEISADQQGPLKENFFRFSGAYLLPIDRKHYLRFGLSLGAGNNSIDMTALDNSSDPALANLLDNNIYMRSDFGVTYHFGRFNAGFALPSLIGHDILTPDKLSPIRVTPLDNILFKGNYRQSFFDDNLAWEPHILYRYTSVGASQYEVTNIFHIKHLVWVGASYRQDAGMVGLLGIKIAEKLGIGYAYDLPSSDIGTFSSGSHEIHLGLHIGTRKEHSEHVSSFIKSHSKSKAEREAEARAEEERRLAAEEARRQRELERTQSLTQKQPEERKSSLLEEGPEPPTETPKTTSWGYISENQGAPITRENAQGVSEEGVTLVRTNADGNKEYIVSFIPEAEFGSEETWSLMNDAASTQERTNAQGQKEVGVQWRVKREDGTTEVVTVWSPVFESDTQMKEAMVAEGVDFSSASGVDEAHNFNVASTRTTMPERVVDGKKQVGFVFINQLADGSTEESIVWVPAPNPNTGERWELADDNEKPVVRIGPNGEKELGVILRQVHPDGTEELMVEYEPVTKKPAPAKTPVTETRPKTTPWSYVSENEGAPIAREKDGREEEGVTLTRLNAHGEKEYIVSFIPEAEFGSEETWSLINNVATMEERVGPTGQKEVGVKWRVVRSDGTREVVTVWSPVYASESLLKEDLAAQGVKIGVKDRKAETDPNNQFKLSSTTASAPRRTVNGEKQLGFVFSNTLPDGTVEQSTIWVPEPDPTSGEKWELAEQNEKPLVRIGPNGEKEMGIILKKTHADGTQELLVEYEPVEKVVAKTEPVKPDPVRTPAAGRNMLEMPAGNYVIVGAFANFDNAQRFSDQLLDSGFFTQVGYHSPKNLYYVQIFSSQSLDQAKNERNRLRKNPVLNNAWVFTIE